MGKTTGFLEFERRGPSLRPVAVRLRDWREVYEPQSDHDVAVQGARCMDCGIPFCMQGCPLGNRIPNFNDLVYRGQWDEAADQLLDTNNFPEFTGRLCPAPCESACVLGIGADPVTIERIEYEVAEHAFARGVAVQRTSPIESGRRVAVVGSGPAGLAAAAQLRSAAHHVEIFERADAVGGLLRYGIPEFKLEKKVLDRRLDAMREAGIVFHTSAAVGERGTPLAQLRADFDAVLLAIGSTRPRLIPVAGSHLPGVHPAMEYLEAANRAVRDNCRSTVDGAGKHVIVLGGGDTGADCLGTAHRHGAASVTQIEIMDQPPLERTPEEPWPTMARLYKVTSAHREGGERRFATETIEFRGRDVVDEIVTKDLRNGEASTAPADLVLIAAGFVGPELAGLGLDGKEHVTSRATLSVSPRWRLEELAGETPVFACGDAVRGQSLIVWAIAEGRSAAHAIDSHLSGTMSLLPAPVEPYAVSW